MCRCKDKCTKELGYAHMSHNLVLYSVVLFDQISGNRQEGNYITGLTDFHPIYKVE